LLAEAPTLLSLIDWVVIGVYAGGLVLLGLLMTRPQLGAADYFLASRASRWPVIGLALIASNMSSTALVGLAGGAYALGLSVYDYEWSANFVLVFFCVFLLPRIIQSRTFTMPAFLEQRFDARVRVQFALLTLFLNIFVDSAGVLYSGSLVCQLLLPHWPLALIIALIAGAAGLYTMLGGLRAVIVTEAVQAVVLLVGALLIALGAFSRAGGWHAVMSGVNPAALSLIRPIGDPSVPWPGLVLGIPLLGFYYWCTNQTIVQRMLSARDLEQARRGALFAGLLKLPVLFLIVLPGTCALLLFPHLKRADAVYPALILHLLPAGLMGLVVAGFIAATMVSIASMLNSASTLITMDVVRQWRPRLSDRELVRVGRGCTALLLVVAVLWAPQLTHFPSLWQYLQAVLAYAVPPVVVVFLAGRFWAGASADGAAATLRLGSLCGLLAFLINAVLGWTHLHFLYVAPLLAGLDALILVGVSRRARGPVLAPGGHGGQAPAALLEEDPQADSRRRRPAPWRDWRVLAAGLLALTAALVIAFR